MTYKPETILAKVEEKLLLTLMGIESTFPQGQCLFRVPCPPWQYIESPVLSQH